MVDDERPVQRVDQILVCLRRPSLNVLIADNWEIMFREALQGPVGAKCVPIRVAKVHDVSCNKGDW